MGSLEEIIEKIEWYHPGVNRHVAESILMTNGTDGTYLMRPSSKEREFALSVRTKDAVKHYPVYCESDGIKFGMATFNTSEEFVKHFENQPLIGGESGVLTVLKYPYPRDVEEHDTYDQVHVHAEFGMHGRQSTNSVPNFEVGTKEGYLTKQGDIFKSWKTRWFVLRKTDLKYFKDSTDKQPIRSLDLMECKECEKDDTKGKSNCFRLVFPWRTFYIYAASDQEASEWMNIIKWKLVSSKN
ncbi:dual adapter for phosphotyrosine and 3-phosphotyrosine and 3-phosphoinositide-like isoform X2 [Lingula anatina]|uniref:Dual adapter for phosphotyrosine and 3-phosphotyrosine and 3-phosphoinositide-like isoform X2 n=1 Tax=Lingula anatina TaxID=7574 RepID=A0A2R2MJ40_LINAN|nr:dual adapter for phosphotyrosine and 3-phosphotyrosine and 3-phosphoinositide-like isoform X2 [Lingula anatina]|eukprot:XP_023930209.1 dual adapter for phosphotyrosine and 3-phosphotyrosine and 3-phosphoinositide-like isoform X2 [Lingula anatina]